MQEVDPLQGKKPFVSADKIAKAKRLVLTADKIADHPSTSEGLYNLRHVIELTKGEKRLTFFGSPHISDQDHPVFDAMRNKFEAQQPDFLFVEGLMSPIMDKERAREIVAAMSLEDAREFGEMWYAIKLAVDAGIDFDSPEPSYRERVAYLLKQGLSKKAIFAEAAAQCVCQYQLEVASPTRADFAEYAAPVFGMLEETGYWEEGEFAELQAGFMRDLSLTSRKYEFMINPIRAKHRPWSETNEVTAAILHFRDHYALEQISQKLSTHNSIFTVYGSGHAVTLEPALRELMSD